MIGEVWQVRRGDEVLGEITVANSDFPWLSGSFAARPEFAQVAPQFVEELALSTAILEDDSEAAVDAWEAAYERIAKTMTLVSPSGPVAEFLLHIDAGWAWFRSGEKPFESH